MTDNSPEILQLIKLYKNFGGLQAIDDVSLTVKRGEIKGLIGPNGAGKSTMVNIVSGTLTPASGRIIFDGLDVTGLGVHEIAGRGMTRTFQNVLLFNRLTVIENIYCGTLLRSPHQGIMECIFRLPRARKGQRDAMEKAVGIARLLDLESVMHRPSQELPMAKQRAVEIARAIATEPKLVLLDEPAAGLTQEEAAELAVTIEKLRRGKSLSILLIDHNMSLIMSLCQNVAVVNFGAIIAEGPPDEIVTSKVVRDAYLG